MAFARQLWLVSAWNYATGVPMPGGVGGAAP